MQGNFSLTRCRRGFTLIELLVVVVIILILAGMLIPVLGQARARARMTKCTGQLTQFGLALVSYRDDHDNTMAPWMSVLSPDYGATDKLYVCPQDPSGGWDGSRPGAGWPSNGGISLPTIGTSPDGDKDMFDILHPAVTDQFFNTDDTERNPLRDASGNDNIPRNSYLYEWADVECTWVTSEPPLPLPNPDNLNVFGFVAGSKHTWNEVKDVQIRQGQTWDPVSEGWVIRTTPWDHHLFPAVRCHWHFLSIWGTKEVVLNTSYEGGFFLSPLRWEDGVY